jgi:hypothetical protein
MPLNNVWHHLQSMKSSGTLSPPGRVVSGTCQWCQPMQLRDQPRHHSWARTGPSSQCPHRSGRFLRPSTNKKAGKRRKYGNTCRGRRDRQRKGAEARRMQLGGTLGLPPLNCELSDCSKQQTQTREPARASPQVTRTRRRPSKRLSLCRACRRTRPSMAKHISKLLLLLLFLLLRHLRRRGLTRGAASGWLQGGVCEDDGWVKSEAWTHTGIRDCIYV